MSTGLLRGLASRAIGAQTSLRPQAMRADRLAWAAAPSLPGDENGLHPLVADPQPCAAEDLDAVADAPQRRPIAPPPVVGAGHPRAAARAAVDRVPERSTPSALTGLVVNGPPPAQLHGHDDTCANAPRRGPPASTSPPMGIDPSRNATAPIAGTPSWPTSLLPPLPARAMPAPEAGGIGPLPSRRTESSAAARRDDRPAEVHVSIGRVELTAAPSSTPARNRARRARPDAGSLADYLHGRDGGPGGRP